MPRRELQMRTALTQRQPTHRLLFVQEAHTAQALATSCTSSCTDMLIPINRKDAHHMPRQASARLPQYHLPRFRKDLGEVSPIKPTFCEGCCTPNTRVLIDVNQGHKAKATIVNSESSSLNPPLKKTILRRHCKRVEDGPTATAEVLVRQGLSER